MGESGLKLARPLTNPETPRLAAIRRARLRSMTRTLQAKLPPTTLGRRTDERGRSSLAVAATQAVVRDRFTTRGHAT